MGEPRPCEGGCGKLVSPFRGPDGGLIWMCQTCVESLEDAMCAKWEPLDKDEDDCCLLCPACGTRIGFDDDELCSVCGEPLDEEDEDA